MFLIKQVMLLFSKYIFKYSNAGEKMPQLKRKTLMQGTQVWVPGPTWYLTTVDHPSSRRSSTHFCLCGYHMCFQYTWIHAGRILRHIKSIKQNSKVFGHGLIQTNCYQSLSSRSVNKQMLGLGRHSCRKSACHLSMEMGVQSPAKKITITKPQVGMVAQCWKFRQADPWVLRSASVGYSESFRLLREPVSKNMVSGTWGTTAKISL